MNDKSTAKLREALQGNLTDYQGIPFWSWNNTLDKKHLVEQIEEMHAVGLGGFIMHARTGLKDEYLGEKWFECIEACLDKAKELGMNAWVYDENGWPSGFVGGKLLEVEEYRAQFLEYAVKDGFDAEAFAVYKRSGDGFVRITDGEDGLTEYHCIYIRTSPANTDILNPDVVDAFIRETHELYYERFADRFGKELVGFFTDEPQYYRWATPYTRAAVKEYEKRYGADIREGLVYLFVQTEAGYEFRTRYYTILNALYTDNYYKKLYDWCNEHGCKLTGHSVEENSLSMQMWGGAGCMPSYEFEHIPGIDDLGRGCSPELGAKQVSGVASQLGVKQVLTETYGCSGYDVTPQELKSIAEAQYFNGVSLMCHHLLPISVAGQGKYDHPPVFSKQNNWYEEFKTFNDHFTRLGYIVSNTKENYDVAVIHPMRNVYLNYVRDKDAASVADVNANFDALLLQLRKNGIQYQLIDERILARHGKVNGNALQVGNCSYTKIIVPKMKSIASTTLAFLKEYTGKLLVEEQPAYVDGRKAEVNLVSDLTFEEIVREAKVYFRSEDGDAHMTSRSGEIGDYIFVKNFAMDKSVTFTFKGIAQAYKALDLETFELKNISDVYTLPKNESLILIKDETAVPEQKTESKTDITSAFRVTGVTENYLVLDYGAYSLDGKQFSEEMPMPQLFEKMLRADYKGDLYIRQRFTAKEKMPVKFIMEKGNLFDVRLNGKSLVMKQNDFDVNFTEADLTDVLEVGENTIVYGVHYFQHEGVHFALFDPMATESVRNCLYYDTHIENTYLKGDFIVNADHSVEKRKTLPKLSSDNYKNGYPFFMGAVTLEGTYDYDGVGERVLSLAQGRFIVAQLFINGVKTDITMNVEKEITSYLQKGKNDIRIVLKSSLRNLFGPHHFKPIPEPFSVSPTTFTFRGSWGAGEAPEYTPVYNSVPFGVDKIEMLIR